MRETAPDGSPVGLYRILPPGPEVDLVAGVTPSGGSVLDLGCGAGRLADALARRGYDVVAVDESEHMLQHVHAARAVQDRIETLHLPQRFDTVVLASHLVHAPTRPDLLAAVARHLKPEGKGLIERYDPHWVLTATPTVTEWGGVRFVVRDIHRTAKGRLSAVVEYHYQDQVWTHRFQAEAASDHEVSQWFGDADLELVRWHSPAWAEVKLAAVGPGRNRAASRDGGADRP